MGQGDESGSVRPRAVARRCSITSRGQRGRLAEETQERRVLRELGLRSTPQRLAVVREVFSRSHPTVGEIYDSVRSGFPTLGLQTVYNTLHTMAQHGLVTELPFSSASRFDSNMRPHANLVCRTCGRIEDAEFMPDHFDTILRGVVQATGFAPDGQRIDVYGLCRDCADSTDTMVGWKSSTPRSMR